jgi:hypothetical protein
MIEKTSPQAKGVRGYRDWRYLEIDCEGLKVVRIGNWVLCEEVKNGLEWVWYWSPIYDSATNILIL